MIRLLVISMAVFGFVSLAEAGNPFVFTAIPDQDESRLRERFDKVADYLSRELEVGGPLYSRQILHGGGDGLS